MKHDITLTHVNARGFAFGVTDTGDRAFLPPHAVNMSTMKVGDTVSAQLVVNPDEAQRATTRFMAVVVDAPAQDAPAPAEQSEAGEMKARDLTVYNVICESTYLTASEIAEVAGLDSKTVHNSANRLFKAGKIARADVHNKPDQARASFVLWAKDGARFVDGEQS